MKILKVVCVLHNMLLLANDDVIRNGSSEQGSDNVQDGAPHNLNTLSHFSVSSPHPPLPLPLYISSDSLTIISEENVNSNLNFNLYGPHTSPGVSPPPPNS